MLASLQPSSCQCFRLMASFWGSFLRFLLILLLKRAKAAMTAILKLVASAFIKLDFARYMETAASNVEEMVLAEMSQYPMGSRILISISVSAGLPTFLSYGCLWFIPNTARANINLFLVWTQVRQPPYLGEIRCSNSYGLPSLYSFPISSPSSIPRRNLILFIFALSSIQSYASKEPCPTPRPSLDCPKPVMVVLFPILVIGWGINMWHNSGQWDLEGSLLETSGKQFLSQEKHIGRFSLIERHIPLYVDMSNVITAITVLWPCERLTWGESWRIEDGKVPKWQNLSSWSTESPYLTFPLR